MIDWTGFKFGKGAPRAAVELQKKRAKQTHDRKVRDTVNKRDKRRCFWAGCQERAWHKHHKVYASKGGKFETENLVSACGLHHRWVHAGLIRLVGNPNVAPVKVELTTLGREAKVRVPDRLAA